MSLFEFELALSAEKTRAIYQGRAFYILVQTDGGLKLQLPAANFRHFVTAAGIHGRFCVSVDADNRILELQRL